MTPNEHPVLIKLAKLAIFITRHIVVKQREEEFIGISRLMLRQKGPAKFVLRKTVKITVHLDLILSLENLFLSFFLIVLRTISCELTFVFWVKFH
jgi:hypothetical protein